MTNQLEFTTETEEAQETPIQAARRRFEYWYGEEAATALCAEIAHLPEAEQVERIYQEMDRRESLAIQVEKNQIYEEMAEDRGWSWNGF